MKRITIFLMLSVAVCSICYSQKLFIYNEYSEKNYLHEIDSLVIVKYRKNVTESDKLRISRLVNPNHSIKNYQIDREIILIDKKTHPDFENLKKDKSTIYISKSLMNDDGTLQIPTDKVLVKMKPQYNLDEILKNLHVEYEQYRRLGNDDYSYLITLDNGGSIEVANKLYESGYFVYAQPSFTRLQGLLNEFYNSQWGLNNTGQNGGTSGIDIKANQAWNITTGSNNIKVAVVDQGVDLNHPDLSANLLLGYDATDGVLGGVNGACLSYDAHGTACAGIIAAIDNTIGTKGVAPYCRIIPVRVTYSEYSSYYQQYIEIWDDDWKVDAINYAWDNAGADIISCSWKSSTVAALTNEINAAITQGRNGKGCVVVFASGNNSASSVSYPASLSNVIAVGANTRNGQWASFSNYGTALDVVAPGVDIYTTDIQGSAGYNTSNGTAGNYSATFGGTSAACPHVAGIAALILSVYPNLTQAQVRQAIESTCTKLSGYSFSTNSSHPNGTWNNQVGHGLVNAHAAVNSVLPTISGADYLCPNSNGTYTISNKPSDATVTWTYNNISLNSANNTTSSSAVFHYGNPGSTAYLHAEGTIYPPIDYYNAWIQATLNLSNGTSFTLPRKYIKEKGLVRGVYQQYPAEERTFGTSNLYSTPDYRNISIALFSDPSITYSWTIENYTKKVTSNNPDLSVSDNGRYVNFSHSYDNSYRLTVSTVYCGASHSSIHTFTPVVSGGSGSGGGGGCMFSYRPGDGTLEVSFETAVLQQTYSTAAISKTKLSYAVQLYNITGSLVKEGRTSGETVIWDLSSLPDGVYILSVKDGNNEIYNKKFLKN
jgi:subtilisin family serine protease